MSVFVYLRIFNHEYTQKEPKNFTEVLISSGAIFVMENPNSKKFIPQRHSRISVGGYAYGHDGHATEDEFLH